MPPVDCRRKGMLIQSINSSSKGNSYALFSAGEILFIEAGIRLSSVMEKVGFDLSSAVGCLVSHGHL